MVGPSKEPNSHEKKRVNWIRTEEESRCLQSLFTSDYEASKARNPDRVPGTCKWFLQSEKYNKWKENQLSDLLWVTADPGCGKSVLSKSLIDNELQNISSSTTCYFFFKDDSADQRSVTKAICALLHQFLCARKSPALLQKATEVFRAHGTGMMESFHTLWNLLLAIAQDPAAGQATCVLDALDECEENGRENLIRCLNVFSSSSAGSNSQLKFLATSRPYYNIEINFDHLTIRLAGEDESEAIQQEIDLVIQERVPRVGKQLGLDAVTQKILQQRLLGTENRTYLWLHLVLEDIVKRSFKVKTPQRMEKFLELLPATVNDAYESILEQSPDLDDARKLLQIVLAAQRPLNLEEINISLHVQEGDKRIEEVDLEPVNSLPAYVKNLCGLFVTIYDSRVYLLHQTAREFLLSQDSCSGTADTTSQHRGIWKHSFQLETCHYVMARVCLTYLLFDVFEDEPLLLLEDEENKGTKGDESPHTLMEQETDEDRIVNYNRQNALFMYASSFWALHFEKCRAKEGLSERWLGICDTGSQRFRTWFRSYWQLESSMVTTEKRPELNRLMVASFCGHDTMIEQLFEKEKLDERDDTSRTALWWAVMKRRNTSVQLLLDRGANQFGDKAGRPPLMVAAYIGFEELLGPLVHAGASLECVDYQGWTPLAYAVRFGHMNSVETLIGQGATIETKTTLGTPLCIACKHGYLEIVELLLNHGAAVDRTVDSVHSPLITAVRWANEDVANLLIDAGANLELRDTEGRTALSFAVCTGNVGMIKLLLEKGADIETKDEDGRTPLSLATDYGSGRVEVLTLLLNARATINTRDNLGRTPLILTTRGRLDGIIRVLVKNDANVNLKDREGRTALCYAAHEIYDKIRRLCADLTVLSPKDLKSIEERIEIPSKTPLESAARSGHAALVYYLLNIHFEREPLQVARREFVLLNGKVHPGSAIYWCFDILALREIMRLLAEHGADIETNDCEGCKSLLSEIDHKYS